jgi:peptidoglycan/LPS O-acetylase OafA/YrhL
MQGELVPLAAVAACGAAVQLGAAKQLVSHTVAVTLAGQCLWIAIGMALAAISVAVQHEHGRVRWIQRLGDHSEVCWAVSLTAFILLMPLMPSRGFFGLTAIVTTKQSGWLTLAKLALQGVLVVFLVLPAIFGDQRRGLPRRLLRSAPVVWLGVISYSFYLWHLTVATWIAQPSNRAAFSASGLGLLNHLHFARSSILYVIVLAVTGVLATLSYRLVELPFLKRK